MYKSPLVAGILGLLHRLLKPLSWAGRQSPPEQPLWSEPEPAMARAAKRPRYHGLRPPTLMIDLLFGALMLFAFHMGDPNAGAIVRHDVTLPSSDKATDDGKAKLLPLVPVRTGDTWIYELIDGKRIDATKAIAMASQKKSRLVLIIAADTPVQSYLDAETPFRKRGARVGLAVRKEGNSK
jgi:hypothetical protein